MLWSPWNSWSTWTRKGRELITLSYKKDSYERNLLYRIVKETYQLEVQLENRTRSDSLNRKKLELRTRRTNNEDLERELADGNLITKRSNLNASEPARATADWRQEVEWPWRRSEAIWVQFALESWTNKEVPGLLHEKQLRPFLRSRVCYLRLRIEDKEDSVQSFGQKLERPAKRLSRKKIFDDAGNAGLLQESTRL